MCAGLLIAYSRTPRASALVETVLLAGTALSLLGRLIEILTTPVAGGQPNHLPALADLLYWFPLVYILAFLIFKSRRRLLAGSLAFLGALLVLGLVYSVAQWRAHGDMADAYVLFRFFLANIIYIILLVASVRLNEQHVAVRALNEAMTRLAHTDPLLAISNRRQLDASLAREVSRAQRHGQPLSVVVFDIDHFKQINDTYGHEAGDAVLKETARLVQSLLRGTDLLGRWGGDEFLVIAPQTSVFQAGALAERLRHGLAALVLEPSGGLSGTFGVAEYQPPETPDAFLKRADEALYASKQAGRNRVTIAG